MYWLRRLYIILWSLKPCINHPDREEKWAMVVDGKRIQVCTPCFKASGYDNDMVDIREMHAEMLVSLEGKVATVLWHVPFIGGWLSNYWLSLYYWPHRRRIAKLRRNGEEPWQRMAVVDARLIRRTE